jgi:hypothetical protein
MDRLDYSQSPFLRRQSARLLVFNIHGTLLDCNFISNRNPNSTIHPTMRTRNRRVVCRPWLSKILNSLIGPSQI